MRKINNYLIVPISLILTLTFGLTARAESYNFNFELDPDGNYLDPFALDKNTEEAVKPVGEIWRSRGVIISTKNTDRPVGLFQSNCVPYNGSSLTATEIPCKQGNYGSNGLATGEGEYSLDNGNWNFSTEPQGNILIIEENPGNGIPQDSPRGGTIRFDFDRTILSSVVANRIGIVDNAKGTIRVQYMDGEEYLKEFNQEERNQLEFYEIPAGEIEYIEVTFEGNGGITGVEFDNFIAFAIPNALPAATAPAFLTPALMGGGVLGTTLAIVSATSDSGNSATTDAPFSPDNGGGQNDQGTNSGENENDGSLSENEGGLPETPNNPIPEAPNNPIPENPNNPNNPNPGEPEPIPEPTMMIGTLMALGFGTMMKRKLREKRI